MMPGLVESASLQYFSNMYNILLLNVVNKKLRCLRIIWCYLSRTDLCYRYTHNFAARAFLYLINIINKGRNPKLFLSS